MLPIEVTIHVDVFTQDKLSELIDLFIEANPKTVFDREYIMNMIILGAVWGVHSNLTDADCRAQLMDDYRNLHGSMVYLEQYKQARSN
jgi:hypothetical protein